MKEKIILFSSVFLLVASFAIIFWINQSEKVRLAIRDRFTIEEMNPFPVNATLDAPEKQISTTGDVEQTFSRLDVLISSIGSDDIPSEE